MNSLPKFKQHLLLAVVYMICTCFLTCQSYETIAKPKPTLRVLASDQDIYTPISKPDFDKSRYLAGVLENELKAFIISEPKSIDAEVFLEIPIGYFVDPSHFPGASKLLAMVLLETRPNNHKEALADFIKFHKGQLEFDVTETSTYFHLKISKSYLSQALEMFGSLLSSFPSKNILWEELSNRYLHDIHLYYASEPVPVHISLYHVFLKSWFPQNRITFSDTYLDLRSKLNDASLPILKDHFEQYYSSNLMYLTVKSDNSIYSLSNAVAEYFSLIPNKEVAIPYSMKKLRPWDAFPNIDFNKWVYLYSEGEPKLILRWKIKEDLGWWKAQPVQFIKYLLTHDGEDSLKSDLQRKKMIFDMDFYSDKDYFDQLTMTFSLINNSEELLKELLKLVFRYIYAFKGVVIKKSVYEEWRKEKLGHFRIADGITELYKLPDLSRLLYHPFFPIQDIFEGMEVASEWNPDLIKKIFNALNTTIQAVVITNNLPEGPTQLCFQQSCHIQPFSSKDINDLKSLPAIDLSTKKLLPPRNPFIVTDEDLSKKPIPPQLAATVDERMKFWYQHYFPPDMPRVYFKVRFTSSFERFSASDVANLFLMRDLIHAAMAKDLERAAKSGNSFEIDVEENGLSFRVLGFQRHIDQLLSLFLGKFSLNTLQALTNFTNILEQLKPDFAKKNQYTPSRAQAILKKMLIPQTYFPEEILDSLNAASEETFRLFMTKFKDFFYVETLYIGTMNIEKYVSWMLMTFPTLTESQYQRNLSPKKSSSLPVGRFVYQEVDSNYTLPVFQVYFQTCNACSVREIALLELYHALTFTEMFNAIQVPREKLFSVMANVKRYNNTAGYFIQIFRPSFDTIQLSRRFVDYLTRINTFLNSLTEIRFETKKREYAQSLIKTTSYAMEWYGDNMWNDIQNQNINWPSPYELSQSIKSIEIEDILNFFNSFIQRESPGLTKISIHLTPTRHQNENFESQSQFLAKPSDFHNLFTFKK